MSVILNRLDEAQFETYLANGNLPLIVIIWADWCGTCQIVAPILASLSAEFESQVEMAIVDYDRSPRLVRDFGIGTLPTFLFFDNGKLIDRAVGMLSKKGLRDKIQELYGT